MELSLNDILKNKIRKNISLKNNWDVSNEIIVFFDKLSYNFDSFNLFIVWFRNYFEALNVPFDLFIESLEEYRKSSSALENMISEEAMEIIRCPKDFISKSERIKIGASVAQIHIELFQNIERHSQPEYLAYIEQDAEKHLQFLEQSLQANSKILFTEYVAWANTTLSSLGISTSTLIRFFISMRLAIYHSDLHDGIKYIDSGVQFLQNGNVFSSTSSICFTQTPEAKKYLSLLLSNEKNAARDYVLSLSDAGMSVRDIFLDIFQASQYEIGRLWELNEISIAQEHLCTAATHMIMSLLSSRIQTIPFNGKKVITACVGKEQHELGIRIISDFLDMDGWETFYLGANVPAQAIISSIEQNRPDLLALSVTLTPHLKELTKVIEKVKEHFPDMKILVGGYPFIRDKTLWKTVGADGVALSARDVGRVAMKLV